MVAFAAFVSNVFAGDSFVLAERGKPAPCGLVLEAKGPTAEFAASEFRTYVEKLTGVKLPEGAVDGRRIVLAPGAADLGEDGFRLVAKTGELRIEGGLRGVLFGVYELLEAYGGVEWFSGWCEEVPRLDRLAVPVGLCDVQKPAFPAREIFWTHVTSDPVFAARLRTNNRSFRRDDPRTGGNSLRFDDKLVNCHTFNTLVPPDKYFKTHPEYFSEVGGKRLGERTQLCLTNPDVLAIATSNVLAAIRRNPSARCFGVSQNDWYNYCECAKCKAFDDAEGSHAGTMIEFANRIADAVKEVAPDKLIITDAYQYTQRPPKTVRPRDNVMVCLSTIECDFSKPFRTSRNKENAQLREDIRTWAAMTKLFHVWDYTTDYNNYLIPYPNVRVLQDNIRFFRENNVYYLFEQGAHGGYHGEFGELKAWLMAKWMWNPDLPFEPLLTRFLRGYYGKAAPAVREYFDLLHSFDVDERQPRLKVFGVLGAHPASSDEAFLAKASALWRTAEAAVADDPVRSYNVRMSAMSIDYVLFMRNFKRVNLSGAPDDGSWKEPGARLAARLKEAADAGRPVLLCESKETDRKMKAKIAAAADGTFVTVGDGSRAWQEEGAFKRMGPKGATQLRDDAAASGGKAMWLANDNYNWYLTYLFDEVAFAPDEAYTLSVRLRADVTGKPGEVVQVGIYDYAKDKSVGVLSLSAKDLKDGYAEYDVKTWRPAPGQGLYIAAGHFDKKKSGVSPAHTGVWIDGFTIRRANADKRMGN